ncbi:succinate dehydrogenase [ubiquinone] flavoprotein subunit, mitochondrial-like [Gossypium australe]|uniref:Succinate dehydrogenase [ubiquinone] flavoprotein subunit, mitochondrial-like n=1 Tax=Gossypium australe TaxID=47621 RepID=A0A5B6VXE6_9ROSI|nr:succinate dehydrogenase [ubiquinone] flavoprotein subunit, mitochondrial-like [Gossypium australe]
MDLMPLTSNKLVHVDGKEKAEFVKQLDNIERRTEQYAQRVNKGLKRVIFEPGDWVWIHMRKERFSTQRRSELLPMGAGLFQVLEMINKNAYKLDLPGEYRISATFNGQITLKRGDDAILAREATADPIELPQGPITWSRAKKFQDAIASHIDRAWGGEVAGLIKQAWSSTPCVPYSLLQAEF